jgi:hypothetical protein
MGRDGRRLREMLGECGETLLVQVQGMGDLTTM